MISGVKFGNRKLISIVLLIFGAIGLISYFQLARKAEPTEFDWVVLAMGSFVYGVLLQRMLLFVFLPRIEVNKELRYRPNSSNGTFDVYVEIENYSSIHVYDVTVHVEEMRRSDNQFLNKIHTISLSGLPGRKGKARWSVTSVIIDDYSRDKFENKETVLYVQVSYVTMLFNIRGYSGDYMNV